MSVTCRNTPNDSAPATGAEWAADRAMPRTTLRVAGVDDPVVPQAAGGEERGRLALDLLLDRRARSASSASSSKGRPASFRRRPGDDRHHAGQLRRAHHGDAVVGPREHEAGVVGPARHAVVAGAVGGPDHQREVGHRRVRHGVDQLRAVLDDPALLVARADHEPGDVLDEQQRDVAPVAQLDELRALLGLLGEEDAVVGDDADRVAAQRRPSRRRAASRNAGLNSSNRLSSTMRQMISRTSNGARGSASAMPSSSSGSRRGGGAVDDATGARGRPCASSRSATMLAADADRVELVDGEVVGEARACGRASRRRRAPPRRRPRRSPSSPAAGRRGRPWPGPARTPCSRSAPARRRRRRWTDPNTSVMVGMPAADSRVRLRKVAPPGTKISACLGRSAPPDSVRLMSGSRLTRAISWARSDLATVVGEELPPRTVGSLAEITHSTPPTRPMPVTIPPPSGSSVPQPAKGESSRNGESGSSSRSIRSRTSSLPRSRWRRT